MDNLILLAFIVRRRDLLLGRFIVMGLARRVRRLAADAWLVDYTRTLDYSIGRRPHVGALADLDAASVGSRFLVRWSEQEPAVCRQAGASVAGRPRGVS